MKKMMITASAFLFSMALTTGVMAAGEYSSGSSQSSTSSGAAMQSPSAQQEQAVKSTNKLIGKAVKGSQGQDIGNVSDIMIDTQTGQVAYALVSAGGVLGMGENQYIVPWNALHTDPTTDTLTLNMSAEQLKNAPKGQTVANREQARKIFQFYGVAPYWEQGAQQQQMQQQPRMMEPQGQKTPGGGAPSGGPSGGSSY
ncbi:MAG: PRC-barrel domain-containing protein [Desulfobacteraceae bacterium]|nr:PRC-barrel domain-containing protein [Desulfobacteraceae bacterium]